ncbi:MAG: hypothetical protein Q4G62_07170 [Pseudomonadota bacterium]|nr:hypothetical protein [Pseudomonadota bacterium]
MPIFNAIDTMSRAGQIVCLRAIANGAVCGAALAFHDAITKENEDEAEEARKRAVRQSELYACIHSLLEPISQEPKYDMPMDVEAALIFASQNAVSQAPIEMTDELLEEFGLTKAEVAAIDDLEKRRSAERDAKKRASIRENMDGIRSELWSAIDDTRYDISWEDQENGVESGDKEHEHLEELVADMEDAQMEALYEKVSAKMHARIGQLIGLRGRYKGAVGEAFVLRDDLKKLDTAFVKFSRSADTERKTSEQESNRRKSEKWAENEQRQRDAAKAA